MRTFSKKCAISLLLLLFIGCLNMPDAKGQSNPDQVKTKFEASSNLGIVFRDEITTYGGAINAGFVFPFNLYVGLEFAASYGNGRYFTALDPESKTIKRINYTQDNTVFGGFLQVGYDITLGTDFRLRPYLSGGQRIHRMGATETVQLFSGSFISPRPERQEEGIDVFAGLLATYDISEQVFVGLNLRTNTSALITIGCRF